jgi:hypothetical protein
MSAAALAAASGRAEEKSGKAAREYYEIRKYHLRMGAQRDLTTAYLRTALVPALNRAGLEPIGVFDVAVGDSPTPHVLIPHKSLESVVTLRQRLIDDAEYRKAGAPFLDAASASPAFDRMESSLLLAFEKTPKMELPGTQKPRIFELRHYESPSERAGKKKIEMFNDAGECALFKRLGFRPVFFGETIVGPRMPNLEYMITFDNFVHRDELWKAFRVDPEWKKISGMPEYKDAEIVSHITSTLLNPAPYSQV